MPRAVVLARWSAAVAITLGYTVLAHHTNTTPGRETLGSAMALAPLLLAAASLAWRPQQRRGRTAALLALLILVCGALWLAWPAIEHHYSRIYWIEHAGTQLVFCLLFARTLATGREPMCSYFARMVHGPLTPVMLRYTRQVTAAWVIFFGMMAAASSLLFVLAPLNIWSAFANFFTLPLTCLMFIAEYAARRHVPLDMEKVSILAVVRVFFKASGAHLPGQHQDLSHANPATDYPPAR